ncbi:MAG: glycoside hydrolase [Actinomycetota bacterium]|nr:glycoside hydrolase [Actinomycetota bacterium]
MTGATKAGTGGRLVPGSANRAPIPELLPTGTLAAEPTLGITKRGEVFYVGLAASGFKFEWPVLRLSKNERWEEVSPLLGSSRRHLTGLDPMLHVDRDTGRLFTADIQGVVGCSAMVSFSDDLGDSWTTSKVCGLTDHQNIFTGPPSVSTTIAYPNVVYYCAADGGALAGYSTASSCVKSLDGGLTWVRTGEPAFHDDPRQQGGFIVDGHCAGLTAHGFVDKKGTVYLPRGWCGQPWLAISQDEGRTWKRVQVATNGMAESTPGEGGLEEHETAVAVDSKGNIYYVWSARNRLPYLAVSRDGGESWSKPMMIGVPGLRESNLPNMDIGADGRIAVAYIGSENAPGGPEPTGAGSEYKDATWNAYVTMTADALARSPLFYTTTVNDLKDPLVIGDCSIVRCQQIYDFIDLDIAPDGTPWVALVDGCPATAVGQQQCYTFGRGFVTHLVGGPRLN